MLIIGFVLFLVGAAVKKTDALSKAKNAIWVAPWLIGLTIISSMGRYGAWGPTDTKGHNWLSRNHDVPAEQLGSAGCHRLLRLSIYYWALTCVMAQADVDAAIERDAHQINFIAE